MFVAVMRKHAHCRTNMKYPETVERVHIFIWLRIWLNWVMLGYTLIAPFL